MTLTWADISEDPNQKDAFQKIIRQCQQFNISEEDYIGLGHVMMTFAMDVMNYEDPKDHTAQFEDYRLQVRNIRLANFIDYSCDFAERRLALVQEGDKYMHRKESLYTAARNEMRVLDSFSEASAKKEGDIHTYMSVFEMLKDQLLMLGVQRKSLSKAFMDAGFVLAKQRPVGEYISFCKQISATLKPQRLKVQTDIDGENGHKNFDEKVLSDRAFLHLEAASNSIH